MEDKIKFLREIITSLYDDYQKIESYHSRAVVMQAILMYEGYLKELEKEFAQDQSQATEIRNV